MNKVYRISHNISKWLKPEEAESNRYFSDLKYANGVLELLLEGICYSDEEWISLDEIEVHSPFGEYQTKKEKMLRYFSDDTKIGVEFNIDEH